MEEHAAGTVRPAPLRRGRGLKRSPVFGDRITLSCARALEAWARIETRMACWKIRSTACARALEAWARIETFPQRCAAFRVGFGARALEAWARIETVMNKKQLVDALMRPRP